MQTFIQEFGWGLVSSARTWAHELSLGPLICEQVGAYACLIPSIRWAPENGLPSLKVREGCHWKFYGLLEIS